MSYTKRQLNAINYLCKIKPNKYKMEHKGDYVIFYEWDWVYVDCKGWVKKSVEYF